MAGPDATQRRRPMPGVRARLDATTETWDPPTARDLTSPLRFLLWLTRSQWRRVTMGAVWGTCWMIGLAAAPWVLARAVDDGLAAGDTAALVGWALVLLAVSVLTALLAIARHRTMTKVRMDASFRSIRATVWHASRSGVSLARRLSTGEVVTVGIADVHAVAQALTVTGPGVGAVVAYALVAAVLFAISPVLAVVILAGVPLLALAVGPFLQRLEHAGREYRADQGRLTNRLVDALAGLSVLNGLGGKAFVARRYEQQSQRLVARGYRVARPAGWVGALAAGLPALFLAAVVWLSARMAAMGAITVGDVVAVYGYVAMLVVPVSQFIEAGGDIARAKVAGQRIIDLLDPSMGRRTGRETTTIPDGCGPLADQESGVSVRPGLLTALVADKAADALALIDRLGRLRREPEAGVAWAGVPIEDAARDEFRHRLVVADNDAQIFAGTVRDVVAGRLEPDDDRIRAAVRYAVAEDVVEALPGGLNATIAAGGTDLSGGQRQRIRLARALYAAPDILIAADPTSAVDANTEAAMIDRLRDARRDTTTVITTTSPLVLDRADEVIVLVDGRVSAVGRHADLLRTDRTYRDRISRGDNGAEHAGGPGE